MQRAYVASQQAMFALLVVIGIAMIVTTLARGGGVSSVGILLGAVLALLGALRLLLARRAQAAGER